MSRKKILILSYSSLHTDPRIKRQIRFLQNSFDISTLGYTAPTESNIKHYSIIGKEITFHYNYPKILRKIVSLGVKIYHLFFPKNIQLENKIDFLETNYEKRYWEETEKGMLKSNLLFLKNNNFDFIIANEMDTLPLALKIAKPNTKVWVDLHEYEPKQFEDDLEWVEKYQKYKEYLCEVYLPKATIVSTVCHGIAEEYAKIFKIPMPIIITNSCNYYDLNPQVIDSNNIKMIHHGMANPSRKIELMIEMMDYLPENYSLDLMLVGTGEYYESLKLLAEKKHRVRFLLPIPTDEIANFINKYDIGLYILVPSSFNNFHALPNKLFEFIQARLAIAISPSPEMAAIVQKYDLGVVSEDFTAEKLANKIKNISIEKLNQYKQNSHQVAFELSSEKNKELMLSTIEKLLDSSN